MTLALSLAGCAAVTYLLCAGVTGSWTAGFAAWKGWAAYTGGLLALGAIVAGVTFMFMPTP